MLCERSLANRNVPLELRPLGSSRGAELVGHRQTGECVHAVYRLDICVVYVMYICTLICKETCLWGFSHVTVGSGKCGICRASTPASWKLC